jgi:hypothetical protein
MKNRVSEYGITYEDSRIIFQFLFYLQIPEYGDIYSKILLSILQGR